MNCIDTNQTKLLNSLSAYVPDPNNLSVPIHERDIVHLFDAHHHEDDINGSGAFTN